MRIGVVSDTHGHIAFARQGAEALAAHGVSEVLHCGDVGSAAIVPLFAAWPTHFVFGNVDVDRTALRAAIESAGQTCHGEFGSLERQGLRIGFLHSDDRERFDREIAGGSWDLVCYGHTHVADCRRAGKTVVLNPGALYRATRHSVAIVDLPSLAVEHVWL